MIGDTFRIRCCLNGVSTIWAGDGGMRECRSERCRMDGGVRVERRSLECGRLQSYEAGERKPVPMAFGVVFEQVCSVLLPLPPGRRVSKADESPTEDRDSIRCASARDIRACASDALPSISHKWCRVSGVALAQTGTLSCS